MSIIPSLGVDTYTFNKFGKNITSLMSGYYGAVESSYKSLAWIRSLPNNV